ncbi:ABC transporter permease [Janibacter alittae]|uniref:ABC transporter permease subunit n=1 Tax=Janibacter alittae TaxID=3115209 RepID=A0ABZ2MK32_9MICO
MSTTSTSTATARHTTSAPAQALAVTRVAIRDRVPLVAVIALVMVAMGALTGALWPSLKDAFADLPTDLSDGLGTILAGSDLTTPVGWMNAEMVSLVLPAGLIAVAVLSAAKDIAGEEQTKTLGVLMSAPVSRTSFLLAKSAAMIINVLLATIGAAAGILLGNSIGDLGVDTAGVWGASVHGAMLAIAIGAIAVLVSALTGEPRLSSSVAAGLAGLAFALNAFLPLSDGLADYAQASPWYYFADSNPLANGADYVHLAVLGITSLVLLALALVAYTRRDLRG